MLTLFRRSVARAAWSCGAMLALLAGFQFAVIAAGASLAERGSFERLAQVVPGFVRDFLGGALTSFAGMVTIGYFEPVPVLMVVLFTVYVATEPAGEVESGLVDLVLARPLARHVLVTRTVLVVATLPAAIVGGMTLSLVAGLWWMAPRETAWPDARHVGLLIAYLLAVAWSFGAIALLVAVCVRRRAAAVLSVAVGVVALYLLEMVGRACGPAEVVAPLSPFHYFPGAALLDGDANPAMDLPVLVLATVVATAGAYWQFGRRDV